MRAPGTRRPAARRRGRIKAALIAAALTLIVQSLPDIKRYLELREM